VFTHLPQLFFNIQTIDGHFCEYYTCYYKCPKSQLYGSILLIKLFCLLILCLYKHLDIMCCSPRWDVLYM